MSVALGNASARNTGFALVRLIFCCYQRLSNNNRKGKYYRLTRAGRKQLEKEARQWEQTTAIMARFLAVGEERR